MELFAARAVYFPMPLDLTGLPNYNDQQSIADDYHVNYHILVPQVFVASTFALLHETTIERTLTCLPENKGTRRRTKVPQ